MSIAMLIPLASQMLGRDISPDVELFFRARAAVGQALPPEEQGYFIENWRGLAEYMESEAGQESVRFFLESWREATEGDDPPTEGIS